MLLTRPATSRHSKLARNLVVINVKDAARKPVRHLAEASNTGAYRVLAARRSFVLGLTKTSSGGHAPPLGNKLSQTCLSLTELRFKHLLRPLIRPLIRAKLMQWSNHFYLIPHPHLITQPTPGFDQSRVKLAT